MLLALSACVGAEAPVPPIDAASVTPIELASAVDDVMLETMEEDRIPGSAVVIVQDGKVVLAKSYGVANVLEKRPVSVDHTVFRIGSISKLVTSLALVQLVDRGALSLDTPVSEHLPGDFATGPGREPIRVGHLLSHSGGFDQVGLRRQVDTPEQRQSIAEFVEGELRPLRPPGQVGVYDTYGIMLAARLVEKVSGLSYEDYVSRHVFEPLGMTSTRVDAALYRPGALAVGYGLDGDELVPQDYEWYVTTPASSIDATAADMGKLLVALAADGGSLLGDEMASRVRSERLLTYDGMGAFSWGFWEAERGGYRVLHHGGIMRGYSSEFYLVPEARAGFFLACNRDPETGPPPRLAGRLTDLLHDRILPPRDRRQDQTSAEAERVSDPVEVDTSRFAGGYGSTVGCYTCDGAGGWPISTFRVEAEGPGLISLYGGTVSFRAVDDLVFVSETSGREIRFLTDDRGRVRYLVQGPHSFARLDGVMLTEVLGHGGANRPPTPLVALVHRANEDWEEAARAYESLAERDPDNGRFAFYEGVSQLNAGRASGARAALDRAIALGQWPAWSQYYVAASHAVEGDAGAAWAALDRAIDLGFDDVELLRTERFWQDLRESDEYLSVLARFAG